jgi:hypothetical protein
MGCCFLAFWTSDDQSPEAVGIPGRGEGGRRSCLEIHFHGSCQDKTPPLHPRCCNGRLLTSRAIRAMRWPARRSRRGESPRRDTEDGCPVTSSLDLGALAASPVPLLAPTPPPRAADLEAEKQRLPATGVAGSATILQCRPLGLFDADGRPVYDLLLTVRCPARRWYRAPRASGWHPSANTGSRSVNACPSRPTEPSPAFRGRLGPLGVAPLRREGAQGPCGPPFTGLVA